MNHPDLIIARITDLLQLAGIDSEEMMEELTDHYLTDIENKIAMGQESASAIREVYKNIASIELNTRKTGTARKRTIILLSLIITAGFLLYNMLSPDLDNSKIVNLKATPDHIDKVNAIMPTGWPIANGKKDITSGFGLRHHPILQCQKLHKGIDIKAKIGTAVIAAGDGTVATVGYDKRNGNYIIIDHSPEYSTKYTHLHNIDIEAGQQVTKGSQIATVGTSGISTAPHLHFELIQNELPVDPMRVLAP